ncbi:NAD(P)-dependent oxidoreductase [Microcella pacifica]|nr:NAD(P)-dependent oxidoreductase [Microcella pacifica]
MGGVPFRFNRRTTGLGESHEVEPAQPPTALSVLCLTIHLGRKTARLCRDVARRRTTGPRPRTEEETIMTTIGFLGLGTMGAPMARRLVQAGHEVRVWNRSPEPVRALAEEGAVAVERPFEALSTPVSLSMFATDDVCTSILTAENLAGARGGVHATMASISPDAALALHATCAQAGVAYVASPVLGRPVVAERGELNILAGGADADVDRLQPFYDAMGSRTWRLSPDPAVAVSAKIAVNYSIMHAIQSLAESITLLERVGVPAATVVELLGETLFGGVAHRGYGAAIAEGSYRPTFFSLELGRKDLRLAQGLAEQHGARLPMAGVFEELFAAALADESLADRDWAAIAELTRRSATG